MIQSVFTPISALRRGNFLYLLCALLLYLLLSPFLQDFLRLRQLYNLFMTAILLASIFSVRAHKIQTLVAVCLAAAMVVLLWIAEANPSTALRLVTHVLILMFLAYIIAMILAFVFSTPEVTRHIIFGAVSAYLLIGIAWSIIYATLETVFPGSFSQLSDHAASHPGEFVYFSFVTITTLGYGDILPLTQKARSLAIGEALIGQIYMTVLIAWLVGLYVSRKIADSK